MRWLRRQRKEQEVNYSIELYDNNTFRLKWWFDIESSLMKKIVETTKAYKDGVINLLDEWEISDPKLKDAMWKPLRKLIRKLEKEIREDIPDFMFVTMIIDDTRFKKVGDKYRCDIVIKGDYTKHGGKFA